IAGAANFLSSPRKLVDGRRFTFARAEVFLAHLTVGAAILESDLALPNGVAIVVEGEAQRCNRDVEKRVEGCVEGHDVGRVSLGKRYLNRHLTRPAPNGARRPGDQIVVQKPIALSGVIGLRRRAVLAGGGGKLHGDTYGFSRTYAGSKGK